MAPAVATSQNKNPTGERALGLVAATQSGRTPSVCFDEARSPVGSDSLYGAPTGLPVR